MNKEMPGKTYKWFWFKEQQYTDTHTKIEEKIINIYDL